MKRVLPPSCVLLLLLGGCHEASHPLAPPTTVSDVKDAPAADEAGEGVSLTPEEVEKMGLVTAAVKKIQHTPEVAGFGVVMPHDAIAAAVAELRSATAMERQSRSAYERGRRLSGTPGAMPADTQDTAERQVTVDSAAVELARRRLSAMFGQHPPWQDPGDRETSALATGEVKLVRVTFPLGSIAGTGPKTLRLTRIDTVPGSALWRVRQVWNAPADAGLPGRSFFALLRGSDAAEGERVLGWAPEGEADSGVEVPAAAVVLNNGKYWCYVEEKPGTFVRAEVDPGAPTPGGYFVKDGVSEGDKVVTQSAGLLLAREINPSTAAD